MPGKKNKYPMEKEMNKMMKQKMPMSKKTSMPVGKMMGKMK